MSSCNASSGLIQSMMNPKLNAGFTRNTPTPDFGIRKNLRLILIGNIFEKLPFTVMLNFDDQGILYIRQYGEFEPLAPHARFQ